jgi:hypothetical protein
VRARGGRERRAARRVRQRARACARRVCSACALWRGRNEVACARERARAGDARRARRARQVTQRRRGASHASRAAPARAQHTPTATLHATPEKPRRRVPSFISLRRRTCAHQEE